MGFNIAFSQFSLKREVWENTQTDELEKKKTNEIGQLFW